MSRLRLELSRELYRPRIWAFGALYSFIGISMFAFLLASLSLVYALKFVWLALPLAFALGAARDAVRDVETGMATVLSSSPVPFGGTVAARILVHVGVASFALVPVAAASFLLARPTGSWGQALVGPHVAWGFLIALTSILWGTLLGLLMRRQPTQAAAVTALGVALAYGSTFVVEVMLRSPLPAVLRRPVLAALHLSPTTWAMGALGQGIEVQGGYGGLILALLLPLLSITVISLSRVHVPRPMGPLGGVRASLLFIILAASVGLALLPSFEDSAEERLAFNSSILVGDGRVVASLEQGKILHLHPDDSVSMSIAFISQMSRPVRLSNLTVSSPEGDVSLEAFNEVVLEPGDWVELSLDFTPRRVDQPDGTTLTIRADVEIDGSRRTVAFPLAAETDSPAYGLAIGLGAISLVLAPAAYYLNRRANQA